ncbi:MAG TPA: hypothetical protein VFZ37_17535 [Jiangellaceae bacterium]
MPLGAVEDRPDYEFADGVTLHVYGLEPGAGVAVTVPALDGSPAATFSVSRDGDVLTARLVDGAAPGWSVLLDGESSGVRLYPDGGQVVAQLK